MDEASSLLAKRFDSSVNHVVQDWVDWLKFVSKSMAVVVGQEAALAEVEVRTVLARHEG